MPDTVPGSTATTATLAMGSNINVVIDTLGDHDWYAVTLTAGVTYVIQTWSQTGSNPDTYLRVMSGSTQLAVNDDIASGNTWSLINFTPTTTGTYYIDAGTYADQSTGTYQLSIAPMPTGATDTVGNTYNATAGTISVGGSVTGKIDTSTDHDVYAISLVAGQTYFFRTSNTTASDALDSILQLRDATGAVIKSNDDAGAGTYSGIRFTATTSGTYYLDVSSYAGANATGNFNLVAYQTTPLSVYTNDQIATQLTTDYWGGSMHHFAVTAGGSLTFNVQGLTAAAQTLAREALKLWTDYTGITFNEVATAGAQLTFDDAESGAFAQSTYDGNGNITSSSINVSTQWITDYGSTINSYAFQTFIHEIGHALGLGHAGNYNSSASYGIDAAYSNDSWSQSVMSYFSQTENEYTAAMGWTRQFVITPMVADAIAMTNLYGAVTTTRTGDTVYGFGNTSGSAIYDAATYGALTYSIIDNGGIDTLNYSGFAQNQMIDLRPETFSNIGGRVGNVSIARGTIIEVAIGGSGADTIFGNATHNIIDGRGGADTVDAGPGDDTIIVENINDIVEGGEGRDMVISSVNYTLSGSTEDMRLTGLGALNATGNNYGNTLLGNDGANVINGLGGIDYMFGYGGNDILYVDNADDVAEGGEGNDWVYSSVSYTLVGWTENVQLQGGADLSATGNGYGNIMQGNSGNNHLDGGLGIDQMYGGAGNDVIYVDNGDDLADGGDGIDLVFSSISYTLGSTTEQLALLGSANLSGLGNGLDNYLFGNSGNNIFWGLTGNDRLNGRAGADALYGGAGADTFIFDHGTGRDIIGDFENGIDKIDLSVFGLTWADLTYRFQQEGNNVWFQLPTLDIIVIDNIQVGQLDPSDFIL